MKRVIIACVLLLVGGSTLTASSPADAQGGRQVWVYFFGWYNEGDWNDPRLQDRPIGRYNSYDDGRIGDQIEMAKGAGIDAFIHTWLGRGENNLTDIVLNKALGQAYGRGFKIGVSVDMVGDGWLLTEEIVLQELTYLYNAILPHPAYLHYNGRPVIYFWNQERFPVATWQRIREQIDPEHRAIWISEGTTTRYIPTFDGLYLFNSAWSPNPGATAQQFAALTRGAGGDLYTPTVMPGWDEDAVAISQNRPNPTDPQDRAFGRFLYNSWTGAITADTDVILIVSWNEYFENSHIEPSEAHGWSAIETLRPLIVAWKAGSPPPPPALPEPPAEAPPEAVPEVEQQARTLPQNAAPAAAGAPTGVKFIVGYTANMRGGPGSDAAIVGEIPFESVLDVIGRTRDSGWVQVNYNGGSGWVALQLGTVTEGTLVNVPVTAP
ncbi:MAG: endo-1,3-alpha-glucanase family glycosylhydrolase [Chloroflexota bacterium]